MARVLVCGAGVFGVTGALTLRARGYDVTLTDPGPIPHPLAESTDISKAVRMDYGADESYTAWMENALDGWRAYNRKWNRELFHETGVLYLSRGPMQAGGFEHDSFEVLTRRGHRIERLDAVEIGRHFPAWSTGAYKDGYYNHVGGFAESGRVVARLVGDARAAGVRIVEGFSAARILRDGAEDATGARLTADYVVVAAGAWTARLVPSLADHLFPIAQPVFHLRPSDAQPFQAHVFPTFGADIAKTGYYGFPATPDGLLKIANHGPGRHLEPDGPRQVTDRDVASLRGFLRETFPALEDAPIASTRVCIYCDTHDEHFWIAPDPDRPNIVVATGGSGHAFKFAPLLGEWIADAVEGRVIERFRWRPEARDARGEEAARHHGDVPASDRVQ